MLLTYVFIIFFSLVNFYLLSVHLIKITLGEIEIRNIFKISAFLFSIFYTFNLYTFFYGYFMFNTDALILSFLPLNILAFLKLYPMREANGNEGSKKWLTTYYASLILMIPGFTTYIFLAEYLVWIFFYFLIYLFQRKDKISRGKIFELGLFFVSIILTQWWWFYSSLLDFADLFNFANTITQPFESAVGNVNLLNSFRLLGISLMLTNFFNWNHYYLDDKWFTLPLFALPFLLIFLISKIHVIKNKAFIIFLFIMLLFSLFIVKLNNPPFAWVLGFAFDNIPFFSALRGGDHKAGLYFLFSYMILASIGFSLLAKYLIEKQKKVLLIASFILILVTGIVLTGPFFLFSKDNIRKETFSYEDKKYTVSSKVQIPQEYYEFKSFFEPKCKGKTAIIIPRGGLVSNAIWPKNNSSYLGWDLMPNLMSCSFITYAYSPSAEANNQAAYRILRQDDIEGFKKFLIKNQIEFVLVRKDHVPYWFSTWLYYNPILLKEKLDKDSDFESIFENDYLELFAYKPLEGYHNYGFNFSSDAVSTNFIPETGEDYASFIKLLSHSPGMPLFTSGGTSHELKTPVNAYAAISECKDCKQSSGNFRTSLEITKEGNYLCRLDSFNEEVTIEGVSIEGDSQTFNLEEGALSLSKRKNNIDIKTNVNELASEQLIDLGPGEYKEIYIGKFKDGRYRFSYELESKELSGNVILSRVKLSKKFLEQEQILEGGNILFTMPFSSSDKILKVERIFTPELFKSDVHYLYLKTNKSKILNSKTKYKNIIAEHFIEDDDLKFACILREDSFGKSEISTIHVRKLSPVKYIVEVPDNFRNGYLIFNSTYNKDWEAYVRKEGASKILPHIKSGFANAWMVSDMDSGEINVEFKRQKKISYNGLFTIFILLSVIFLYLKVIKKNEKNK